MLRRASAVNFILAPPSDPSDGVSLGDLNSPIIPELSLRCIVLGYQLNCFSKTDSPVKQYVSEEALILAAGVVALYAQPEDYHPPTPPESSGHRIRTRSRPPASVGYPTSWVSDHSLLTAAVKRFVEEAELLKDNVVYQQWLEEKLDRNVIQTPAPRDRHRREQSVPGEFPDDSVLSPRQPRGSTESVPRKSLRMPNAQADRDDNDNVPFSIRQLDAIRNIFKVVMAENEQSSSKGKKPNRPGDSKRGRSRRRTPSEDRRKDPTTRSRSRPRRRDSPRNLSRSRSRSRHSRRERRRDPDPPYDSDASAGGNERRGGEDNRFRPEEIGYFNPYLEVSSSAPAGDITNISDKTFYRNVHLFVDAFKDVASTKSSGLVRRNLNKCLRGGAQDW